VVYLVVFGATLSTMVSASVGVASLLAGDAVVFDHVPSVWRTWWLGDMGGDLIVAPALLIAAAHRSFTRAPGRAIEAIALAVALAGTSVLVFSQSTPVTYVIFPLMAWAALRFLQPGAAAASLLVASIAVAFTANGDGPFATSGPDARLLLAQTFVAVAAVTSLVMAIVTNARHRAEETQRKIAQTLQRGLLPRAVPPIAGWEIATFYEPAGAAEVEVGGDFFDFFATDAGWIVVLGDVTGKGVEAATMTALMRNGARVASQMETGPAAILARLDQALREQPTLPPCSALCARLGADHIIVSSAGHPRPLAIRHDGRIEQVDDGGSPTCVVRRTASATGDCERYLPSTRAWRRTNYSPSSPPRSPDSSAERAATTRRRSHSARRKQSRAPSARSASGCLRGGNAAGRAGGPGAAARTRTLRG
jgi:hypothetical protein